MTKSPRPASSAPRWRALLGLVAALTLGLVSAPALAADEIRLLKAHSAVSSYRGQSWQDVTYTLLVKNLAYEKFVYVYQKQPDGSWVNLPGTYVGPASPGFEIWRVTKQYPSWGANPEPSRDLEFVPRLVVGGTFYWDNNWGANYHLGRNDGPMLHNTNVLVDASFWRANGDLDVSIDVKNLAYTKSVTVVYTTDNWATSHEAPAGFVSGYTYAYAYINSPNVKNVERWQAHIPGVTGASLKFAVRYQVNGQTYWDNNFGQDYRHAGPTP
ncbi:carbohydrate-binding protein [Pyxidicoccus xibeiensis]|uniref:carbohydrate-binding protein n=1 Tax=Pyxidicoccus xibeiensis TaxID=2906759 RepID=UPI0020A77A53|nr:carbohydrate-binding protein [Pyxidicoccus xibeiensis]MCP3145113.1 CBM21 domain-containing protein [Pyxidicoccus xibeiensis]